MSADSFFEDFENRVVCESKAKKYEQSRPEALREERRGEVCKSLERLFSMCNAGSTVVK